MQPIASGSTKKWAFSDAWTATGPVGTLTNLKQTVPIGSCSQTQYTNYVFTDPGGTQHLFPVARYLGCAPPQSVLTGNAVDASGYYADISNQPLGPGENGVIVRGPDGTKIDFTTVNNLDGNGNLVSTTNPTITDPNGNRIGSTTYIASGETDWADTLGQTVLKVTNLFNGPNGSTSETDYNRLAVDGSYQTVAVKYEFVTIQTNFGCSGITEYTASNVRLVSEIDLPNGQKYSFAYEPTPGFTGPVTGRLQQVTLPTGGTITYQFTGANGGINCADGTILNLTRTVSEGTTSATWTYARSPNGKGGATTITAPQLSYDSAANQTVITFDPTLGFETNRKVYQGTATGNALRTMNTTWTNNNSGFNNTPMSRTVILEDGVTQSEVETTYDLNGLLKVSKEHDWGNGAPGAVLRTSNFSYLATTPYTSINIINKLTNKTVSDSSGTVKDRIDITYDDAGYVNSRCVTGAPQHDDANYGCSYTTRGLPTSVTTYTDAASPAGGVTKNFSYDSVGNMVIAQLNCCQQKQWNFSATTQYAFPDSVVSGPTGQQLTSSATYYVATGEVATSTDENGQVTTYTYNDPGHLDRLTDVARPDGAHITHTYNDSQLTASVTTPVQGTNAVQKITAFDGLGRPTTDTIEDAGNTVYSIVQTQYDVLGRAYKSSNPYSSSPQFWTTTQFDALGRPTVTTLQDGAQAKSTYATNGTTATDPAGIQRRGFSDGLGRLIEVDESGAAFAGTQAQGSVSISGSLGSKPSIPSSSGQGNVTIKGTEQITVTCARTCTSHWDTGTVTATVYIPGHTVFTSAPYGQNSSAQSLANTLAAQFINDGNFQNVTVLNTTGPDNIPAYTIYLTAKAVGSVTNYSYSASQTGAKNDFTSTAGGATFTGGTDGQNGATDSGTISLTVGTFTTAPVCYGTSCNSTASQVASALAAVLGASGSPVGNISVSGSTISMTANQAGTAWNVNVTATPTTNDPADFPQGSFASQGSLTGGADPYSSGLAHPYVTTYSYGVFDNLLQVTQGVQTRSYSYDGMGRLASATTPEAGQVSYQYNSFDLVTQRTDARGVVTTYGYDGLNRLQSVSYNVGSTGVPATPSLSYAYGTDSTQNNNGRLLTVTDGVGSETYAYDLLGRATQLQKKINGTIYTMGYGYNLAGEVTSITYPSGRVVQRSFDAIGRLCEIAPQTTGCGTAASPYATAYGYNTAFEATGFSYGNGVAASFGYSSDRLQLTSLSYVKGTQTLFGLNYFYGHDSTNCPNGVTGNNGQIQCITDSVDSGRSVAYTYDTLGRLLTANTTGSANYSQWGLSWSYDRYGNRTAQNVTAGSMQPVSTPVDPTTNRVNTLSYDTNGNMLNDGTNALVYDAENREVSNTQSSAVSTYSYDCKSLRVVKNSGGNTTVYIFSGSEVIGEYVNGAAPSAPTREYVYSGAVLLAKIEGGAINYYHDDHLSARLLTDGTGAVASQEATFPFGESWYDTSNNKWKFTTYERDPESAPSGLANGNDYAVARFYVNRMGRFGSADPVAGSGGNPQSLNRYSYVMNDPINSTDPSGQFITGITQFLDPAGFGSNGFFGASWNEFELMEIPVYSWGFTNQLAHVYTTMNGVASPGTWTNFSEGWVNVGTGWMFAGGSGGSSQSLKPWEMRGMIIDILKDRIFGCGRWFRRGKGSAVDIIAHVPIKTYEDDPWIGGDTNEDPESPIFVNTKGPFDNISPFSIGHTASMKPIYDPGSFGARMVILLHELAHKVHAPGIANDRLSPGDSEKNTRLVIQHCGLAIAVFGWLLNQE